MTARLAAVCALALLASSAVADPPPVRTGFQSLDEALKAAAQQHIPLCLTYTLSEKRGDLHESDIVIEREKSVVYQNLLKFHAFSPPGNNTTLQTMVKRLGCSTYPMFLLCDGRGCVLGIYHEGIVKDPLTAKETDSRTITEQINTAWSIVNWEKSVDAQLATLDDKLKNHQYAAIPPLLDQIDAQDKKMTSQIASYVPWQPADQRTPWLYGKEIKDGKNKLKEAIQKEVEADLALLAAGKRKPVRDSLDTILFYKEDPELAKKIADLKKQFDRDPKFAGPTAPVSAASAAPAAAK
jgi:hypothetical protein